MLPQWLLDDIKRMIDDGIQRGVIQAGIYTTPTIPAPPDPAPPPPPPPPVVPNYYTGPAYGTYPNDLMVADTGGTHTTLTAALAAASTGTAGQHQRIFVGKVCREQILPANAGNSYIDVIGTDYHQGISGGQLVTGWVDNGDGTYTASLAAFTLENGSSGTPGPNGPYNGPGYAGDADFGTIVYGTQDIVIRNFSWMYQRTVKAAVTTTSDYFIDYTAKTLTVFGNPDSDEIELAQIDEIIVSPDQTSGTNVEFINFYNMRIYCSNAQFQLAAVMLGRNWHVIDCEVAFGSGRGISDCVLNQVTGTVKPWTGSAYVYNNTAIGAVNTMAYQQGSMQVHHFGSTCVAGLTNVTYYLDANGVAIANPPAATTVLDVAYSNVDIYNGNMYLNNPTNEGGGGKRAWSRQVSYNNCAFHHHYGHPFWADTNCQDITITNFYMFQNVMGVDLEANAANLAGDAAYSTDPMLTMTNGVLDRCSMGVANWGSFIPTNTGSWLWAALFGLSSQNLHVSDVLIIGGAIATNADTRGNEANVNITRVFSVLETGQTAAFCIATDAVSNTNCTFGYESGSGFSDASVLWSTPSGQCDYTAFAAAGNNAGGNTVQL